MKKKIYNNNELDLFELSIIIWNKKLKIFLITVVISLTGISYNFFNNDKIINTPSEKSFEFMLKINPVNNSQFFQFVSTMHTMNDTKYHKPIIMVKPTNELDQKLVFYRFVKELMDYEELVITLNDNPNFIKNIANLKDRERKVELYKYAKLLTIIKNQNLEPGTSTYYLKFKWPDVDQGVKILNDTLNLTLKNLEKSIFEELDDYFELNKYLVINRDIDKMNFLMSQRKIAKELNIEKSQIDNNSFYLFNNTQDTTISLTPYYLVGYEAIDNEIESLKDQKYNQIDAIEKLYKKIKIKNDNKWVEYNMLTLSIENLTVKSDDKTSPTIAIILFGLIIAVFYVLISNQIEARKSFKRK